MFASFEIRFEGESALDTADTRAGLVVLVAMLVSFLFIRTSARLMRSPKVTWWPGSVKTEGGLHVHHLVFGIVLLLAMGFALALQPPSPWLEIVAALFGIGAGLTLDEYALWLHLEDVYWAEQGRRSVDAVVIATVIGGLILFGFLPFSADAGTVTIVLTTVVVLGIAVVAVLKGKVVLGVAGMLFPPAGIVGALRLAKPGSPWARRRYAPESRKLARATERDARYTRRYQRFQDRVAGAPAVDDRADGA